MVVVRMKEKVKLQEYENTCVCGEEEKEKLRLTLQLNWPEAGVIKVGKTRRAAYRVQILT